MIHVLGIDAGGTKTVCLLADGAGRILASARGQGANLKTVGELGVEKVRTPPRSACVRGLGYVRSILLLASSSLFGMTAILARCAFLEGLLIDTRGRSRLPLPRAPQQS